MAISPIHEYFVLNDHLKPVSAFILHENEGGIYEVVRIENGVPLFFEEHIKRLSESSVISGIKLEITGDNIKSLLEQLISANKTEFGNVLISLKENFKAFFIPHKYPGNELYQSGIECGILFAERINPNAKVFQTQVRQLADDLMSRNNLYEVLLVDHRDRITEGSRSNVFFVKDNIIATPPGNEVLLGITRTKAIQVAVNLGLKVKEEDICLNALDAFESAFITGTSPKILPVKRIENVRYDPQNDKLQQLISGYNYLIEEYINRNKANKKAGAKPRL